MTPERDQAFRIPRRRALAAFAVPVLAAALPSIASAAPLVGANQAGKPAQTGGSYAYANLNTSGTNHVAGFVRNGDGSLTALSGSPFTLVGAGSGAGLASQGALQVALGGRLLLAADAGSSQIEALWINSDGSLTPVAGGPVSSGGNHPVSIAVREPLVYVSNSGNGGANYTGFWLGDNGTLTPIAGSTVSLPDGSGNGDVLIDPKGKFLVGTRTGTSLIDSFTIDDGRPSPAPNSPIAGQGLGQLGSAFRGPAAPQLFVSNAHNGPNLGTVSAYLVTGNGTLNPIGASPFPDNQTATCWVTISPDGRFLFATNTGSNSISSFQIAGNGSLTFVSTTVLNGGSGLGAIDLRIDATGRTLYQLESAAHKIGVLAVTGGTLKELPSSPVSLPSGGSPSGLAIT